MLDPGSWKSRTDSDAAHILMVIFMLESGRTALCKVQCFVSLQYDKNIFDSPRLSGEGTYLYRDGSIFHGNYENGHRNGVGNIMHFKTVTSTVES